MHTEPARPPRIDSYFLHGNEWYIHEESKGRLIFYKTPEDYENDIRSVARQVACCSGYNLIGVDEMEVTVMSRIGQTLVHKYHSLEQENVPGVTIDEKVKPKEEFLLAAD